MWSSTGYPSAATIFEYWGYLATSSPISKKVAGTRYCSSTESTAGVYGLGPSSKVRAMTLCPAVAAPPGACDVVNAGWPPFGAASAGTESALAVSGASARKRPPTSLRTEISISPSYRHRAPSTSISHRRRRPRQRTAS